MAVCATRDARCPAIRWARATPGPAMVYGTPRRCLVATGVEAILPASSTWADVDAFLERHAGKWRVGSLGFGLHAGGSTGAWLVVPADVRVAEPDDDAPGECVCADLRHRSAEDDDVADPAAWFALADAARAFVGDDPERRLTVARRVDLREPVDVAASLRAGGPWVREARGWYVRADGLEHAGVCPEVLAEGDVTQFDTVKLSGTGPRSDDPTEDARLREAFERDEKIAHEHTLSRRGTERALKALGPVEAALPRTLDLSTLRHRVTDFVTRPAAGTSIGACLRAIHPSGAFPGPEGLAVIARHEQPARGAWYGLVGVVRPDGSFSFTQVLRAVFRDASGPYAWAGAAFTRGSDPADERAETRRKLSSIRVAGA